MSPNFPEIQTVPVTAEHLEDIIAIDAAVGGMERPEYFRTKLARAISDDPFSTSLVAKVGPKVVGFIMGDVLIGEFGVTGKTVTVDTIGVHPEYRRRGVARTLLEDFLISLHGLKVERVLTFVDWSDWDLMRYFHAQDFKPGTTLALERKL